jgi:predicted HTH transcriptional regulator
MEASLFIMAMVGAAIGGGAVNFLTGAANRDRFDLGTAIGAIAGSVLVLALFLWAADHFGWKHTKRRGISAVISEGETSSIEFKSTARVNLHAGARDDRIEIVVARTVAGFLDSDGGLLVIGVDDSGGALGLDEDLAAMKAPDHDRYERWLIDYLQRALGKPALAFVTIGFEPYAGEYVVVVTVEASERPVFVDEPKGGRTADFGVRMGNSTRSLLTDKFSEYQRSR